MVVFKELQAEGFGSLIDKMAFILDQPGLNIIRGKVGAGKTSIPSVLCWTLFGSTLKEKSSVNTWEELRTDTYAGTMASVIFEKEGSHYRITRCLNYKKKIKIGDKKMQGANNLLIYKDGELDGTRNKSEKQTLIEDLIGYSFDLFKSSVVFGQKMKKIIEETGPQKKKVFEEAFDVGFVNEAKDLEKDELEKLISARETLDNQVDKLITEADSKEDLYNDALENELNFDKDKKDGLKGIREDIKEHTKEISLIIDMVDVVGNTKSLEDKIITLEDKQEKLIANNYKHDKLRDKVERWDKQIIDKQKILDSKARICPECGQDMDKKHRVERNKRLKAEIKELNLKVVAENGGMLKHQKKDTNSIKIKVKETREKLKIKEDKISQAKAYKKRLPRLEEKLSILNENKDKLEAKELKIKSTKYKQQLKKLDKQIDTLKIDMDEINQEIQIKEWLIKDPLSSNGLKAYMFDSLMAKVNIALEEYSRILGFQVEFGIDLDTHRKDFYQAILYNGIVVPYEDLSGGQKQLVDTSVAFAIHDVVREVRPTNILFMDEPFESLGVDEIETIEELVETKSRDKCLFLMTHHESFNPRNTNDILVERDEKGQTQIF